MFVLPPYPLRAAMIRARCRAMSDKEDTIVRVENEAIEEGVSS